MEGETTDFLRASLRAFSSPSRLPTGDSSTSLSDCTLPSISLIWSALSMVCCKGRSTLNRMRRLGKPHIGVLYENRKGTNDRFEGQKHIRRFVDDIDSDLCCCICRPPTRLFRRSMSGCERWTAHRAIRRRRLVSKARHSGCKDNKM